MAELTETTVTRVTEDVRRRWQALDPLLPQPAPARGAHVVVPGDAAAFGYSLRTTVDPDSPRAVWGPLERFELTPRVTDVGALDRLLTMWGELVRADVAATSDDSAALLSWPSRDHMATRVLLAHGLQPRAAVLVRLPARDRDRPLRTDNPLRPARVTDLDAVTALRLEVLRYDADCGLSTMRTGTPTRVRETTAAQLRSADHGIWVAERDGAVVGTVIVGRPSAGGWLTGVVAASPAAYLGTLGVTPALRGKGIGTALADHAHRLVDDAGGRATVLHMAVANPLSAPFWARSGYRPLWFEWRVQPAAALR